MTPKTRVEKLRRQADVLRRRAAEWQVDADRLDREADALEEDVLDEERAAETAAWYFNTVRRMRACH